MLLQANGRPYEPSDTGLPPVLKSPPSWVPGKFKTVLACEQAANLSLWGQFQYPSWLIEQTLKSPRVRGPFQTRCNGLTGTDIQWLPGRDNAIGRRAALAIVEDWPLIASSATRYQLTQWGLTLGVAFAQKHWYVSPTSGRAIPRLEVWHPQWCLWDWGLNDRRGAYRIWTLDGWEIVPSPALQVPGETPTPSSPYPFADPRRWVVHEPFGTESWRQGLVHAIWASALGWQFADSDMSALCEKQGVGGFKLKYPRTTEAKGPNGEISPTSSLGMLMTALRATGRRPVFPVEQYNAVERLANYDVETFEWSGVGFDIVKGTKESKALDLGVLILGHNTTVSSTTAGASAGANVGNLIRGDLRVGDCWNECATIRQQVLGDWAEHNFGDRCYAPVGIYITDAPMVNQPAAQTLLTFSQAVQILRAQGVPDDAIEQLFSLFQIPVGDGIGPVKQPAAKGAPSSKPAEAMPS
jgi:hypothetical protein